MNRIIEYSRKCFTLRRSNL